MQGHTTKRITRPAAAKLLGVGVGVVDRLIERGELAPAYRIGGRVLVDVDAVDQLLEDSLISS